jgi:hypothetical protein
MGSEQKIVVTIENAQGKQKQIGVNSELTFEAILKELNKDPKEFELQDSSGVLFPLDSLVQPHIKSGQVIFLKARDLDF